MGLPDHIGYFDAEGRSAVAMQSIGSPPQQPRPADPVAALQVSQPDADLCQARPEVALPDSQGGGEEFGIERLVAELERAERQDDAVQAVTVSGAFGTSCQMTRSNRVRTSSTVMATEANAGCCSRNGT